MRIHIVAAALPPQLDGIGDYTANLAAELSKSAEIKILTALGFEPCALEGVAIQQVFSPARRASIRAILPIIEADAPDWMLLQYNPFAYGRHGLNPYLPLTIGAIKKRCPQTRVAVMVHETFMPPINLRFAVMSTWQRAQLWSLGRNADVLFFSIEYWAQRFARWFSNTAIHHLPVGSNIRHAPIRREEARARLGIAEKTLVLGVFGTAHPSRMLPLIRSAVDAVGANRETLILYIGPDGSAVRALFDGLPILAEGPLASEEVSRRFSAMDIALTPYLDGVSTRRTSMMTGFQHGVATLGVYGVWTDPMLKALNGQAFLLADIKDPADFRRQALQLADDADLRRRIGETGRDLYNCEFSWDVIVSRMLRSMLISRGA